jgi:ABC-2 type transport system permease protein
MMDQANWISWQTITGKEINRFTRLWGQTIIPPLITTSLYFIIFGNLIGSQISSIKGFSFVQFITPGLVMMAIITSAYMNVCSSFYIAKFQRSIEEILVSPTSNHVIILGYIMGGILRSLLIGTLILFISLFFTKLTMHSVGYFVLFSLFTAVLFSLAGLINAIFANSFDDIAIIPTFILTPLSYLGGIFYSIEQLSPFWQNVSKLNPIFYLINGLRYSVLGVSDVSVAFSVNMLLVSLVILYLANLYLLNKGIGLKN